MKKKNSFKDFGEQFQYFQSLDGYHSSLKLLNEIISPFDLKKINNKIIMEVGIVNWRVLKNLIKFNPKKVFALEPSKSLYVAKKNLEHNNNINYLKIKGSEIQFINEIDYVFSIGVIHHIPDYKLVLKKIYNSLKTGGQFIVWVYGKEGNKLYLLLFNNLRKITSRIPDKILLPICIFLSLFTYIYGFICKIFNFLPLSKYFLYFFNKLSFRDRVHVIFDQLNPSFSKYFTRSDIESDLINAGFKIECLSNRLGYSYLAVCVK